MTWEEYSLARQYLLEERIGTRLRERQHVDNAKFKRSTQNLQRLKGVVTDGVG